MDRLNTRTKSPPLPLPANLGLAVPVVTTRSLLADVGSKLVKEVATYTTATRFLGPMLIRLVTVLIAGITAGYMILTVESNYERTLVDKFRTVIVAPGATTEVRLPDTSVILFMLEITPTSTLTLAITSRAD